MLLNKRTMRKSPCSIPTLRDAAIKLLTALCIGACSSADGGTDAGSDGGIDALANDAGLDTTEVNTGDSGGCDANPKTDPHNCGVCGHDCLGGACNAGMCQPVMLASGENYPTSIVLGASAAYWIRQVTGEIVSCALLGCGLSPGVLASNGAWFPSQLVSDSSDLYWTNTFDNSVMRCGLGPCSNNPTTLAVAQPYPAGITIDATKVFWADANGVSSCDKTGGNYMLISSAVSDSSALAVDSANVYWGDNGIVTCPKTGCGDGGVPTVLAPGLFGLVALVVEGTNVFWAANGTIQMCGTGGCGGTPTTLVTGGVLAMAVYANTLFWASNTGLQECDFSNCTATTTTLATIKLASSIAVDSAAVYWTDWGVQENDVWMLAR